MISRKTVILPISYFPPVSYFAIILGYDDILLEQMETYPKQTFRNRCEIMTSSGRLNLVVPVSKPNGNHTLTRDIEICYRESWQQLHWKSIRTAYRSSPYFNFYEDLLMPLFEKKERKLIDLNLNILITINKLLKISIPYKFSEEYEKDLSSEDDYRSRFTPQNELMGLTLPIYPQVFNHRTGFLANLSILDLLFNLGPDAKGYLSSCV